MILFKRVNDAKAVNLLLMLDSLRRKGDFSGSLNAALRDLMFACISRIWDTERINPDVGINANGRHTVHPSHMALHRQPGGCIG